MSYTVSIASTESTLVHTFNPQIHLDGDWEIALVLLETYNAIPNITEKNNKFHYGDGRVISLDTGCYQLIDIIELLEKNLNPSFEDIDRIIHSAPTKSWKDLKKGSNKNIIIREKRPTFQIEIYCTENIDFTKAASIAPLLGFSPRFLEKNRWHLSDKRVNPSSIETLLVSTNISSNWWCNGKLCHAIYQTIIEAPPGERLNIQPKNLIYYPIVARNLHTIVFKIEDQAGNPISFAGETITLCAHIRQKNVIF